MAEQPSKPEYYYFEHNGDAFTVPSTDTEALQNFVYRLGAKQISEYDKNVLVERRNLRDAGALGYLEAGARGIASGLTLSATQALGDPARQKAITEEFPGTFYGTDIATGIGTAIASAGLTAKGRAAAEATKIGVKTIARRGPKLRRVRFQEALKDTTEAATEEALEQGFIRSTLAKSPAGLLTRGAEAITNKALAKAAGDSVIDSAIRTIAPYTVPAALESGVYGFTQGMADQYLNDPYSSDAVLASAGFDAAFDAFLLGGGFGLGLTGAITTAKLTPAAITKTAKAIYKPLADNFGETFASGLGKFVASEDPKVQQAFVNQLTGILQFNDDAQSFAAKMQRLQKQIADMEAKGVEQAVIAKTFDDQIKGLRLDKAELDANSKKAAASLKGLRETLTEQRRGAEKELGLQQQALLDGIADDLQQAIDSQAALRDFFGDTVTKSGTKTASEGDAAIRQNLQDATLDFTEMRRNIRGQDGVFNQAINELDAAASVAKARGNAAMSQSLTNAANTLREFQGPGFLTAMSQKDISRDVLADFYLNQRRAIRRADADISEAVRAASEADRIILSPDGSLGVFGAMGNLRKYNADPKIFGSAGKIEGVRAAIQKAFLQFKFPSKATRKKKADPYTILQADELRAIGDNLNRQIDGISDLLDQKSLKSLRDAANKISEAASSATQKVDSVNEFNRVAAELGALLGKGKLASLPKGSQLEDLFTGSQIEEAMQSHFDDILMTFSVAVDEAKNARQFSEAMQGISDKMRLAERKSLDAKTARDNFLKDAKDPDMDPDIKALLTYRSGKKGVDGVGALVMANLLGIPEEIAGAALGVSSARNNPMTFLNGVAAVASAANKADQAATRLAKSALGVVTDPAAAPIKLKKRQSVMGKLIGLPTGLITADGSVDDKQYEKAVKQVRSLQANPTKRDALLGRIDSPFPQFGDFTLTTKTKITVAVDFLNSIVPVNPAPPPFQRVEPEAPPSVKRDFAQAVEQINDPEGQFFSELSKGTISSDSMMPMRAVYPDLYANLLMKTVDVFSSSGKEIPFSTRLALGFTIGPEVVPSMDSNAVAMMQANISQPLAGQEQPSEVKFRQGAGKVLADAHMTQTDSLLTV